MPFEIMHIKAFMCGDKYGQTGLYGLEAPIATERWVHLTLKGLNWRQGSISAF